MNQIEGTKRLERWSIPWFMAQVNAPVTIPDVLLARGIAGDPTASQAMAARQIMARLVASGLVLVEKRAREPWPLHFTLTPEGRKVALLFQEYVGRVHALQERLKHALESRDRGTENSPSFPVKESCHKGTIPTGKIRANSAPPAQNPLLPSRPQGIPILPTHEKSPTITSKIVSPTEGSPRNLPIAIAGSTPKPAFSRPTPCNSIPTATAAPRGLPLKKSIKCKGCLSEYSPKKVQNVLAREGTFECDCGKDLTGLARELMDQASARELR